jgi:hypothetical protein
VSDGTPPSGRAFDKGYRFPALAVLGDFAVFMVFAGLGRGQHGESRGPGEIVVTGLPFFAAWIVVAALAGKYRANRRDTPADTARRTALTWLMAWPIALAIRAAVQHRGIPPSFDIVALIANGVLLCGWRVSLQAVTRRGA